MKLHAPIVWVRHIPRSVKYFVPTEDTTTEARLENVHPTGKIAKRPVIISITMELDPEKCLTQEAIMLQILAELREYHRQRYHPELTGMEPQLGGKPNDK